MKLTRIAVIGFIFTSMFHNLSWGQLDKSRLCEITGEIAATQHLDLSFESKFVGKCVAAISENLPAELRFESGDYDCTKQGRIAILSDEMLFVENVRYAIQIDKIRKKRNGTEVRYSIIEFLHNRKKGENKKTFSKGKVILHLGN
jgi:hypothetical protein